MKSLKEQLEQLIMDNVPKNINLAIPVSQDKGLQEYLNRINEQIVTLTRVIESLDSKIRQLYIITNRLLSETEQARIESCYRSIKNKNGGKI